MTMPDDRTRLAQDVERELRDHFPELVFETVIPRSVRVAEAPSYGLPVIEHAPASPGAVAYRELARELTSVASGTKNGAQARHGPRPRRDPPRDRAPTPASCASCRST